jgi:hypothetical protein
MTIKFSGSVNRSPNCKGGLNVYTCHSIFQVVSSALRHLAWLVSWKQNEFSENQAPCFYFCAYLKKNY